MVSESQVQEPDPAPPPRGLKLILTVADSQADHRQSPTPPHLRGD